MTPVFLKYGVNSSASVPSWIKVRSLVAARIGEMFDGSD